MVGGVRDCERWRLKIITIFLRCLDVLWIARSTTKMLAVRFHRDVQLKHLVPALVVILFSSFPKVLSDVTDRSVEDFGNDFKCKSGTVITARFVCDGESDCGFGDESDEQNCVKHQSLRDYESSEELFGTEEVPQKVDKKTPEEDATIDDHLHDDVSAIGTSWYKRFSRSSGTNLEVPMEREFAMLDFLKIASYYLKLESLKLESQYNLRRSEFTYPLVAFTEQPPNIRAH